MKKKQSVEPKLTKRILNCLPSPKQEKNWGLDVAKAAGLIPIPRLIPVAKDLRAAWWGIGDQGQTGSCVGWGTGEGVLRWHFVKAGKLSQTDSVSVRQLFMSAKETDVYTTRPTTFIEEEGTWITAALDIARKLGVVTAAVLPFENPAGSPELYTAGNEATFYAIAAQRRISTYTNLGLNPADWRAWIANNGPIATRLNVDSTWDNATATHGNLAMYDAAHTRGGHCVALVGYTADQFIVRNSWGTGWGDKGFAYASNQYAAAAFTEAYGVSV